MSGFARFNARKNLFTTMRGRLAALFVLAIVAVVIAVTSLSSAQAPKKKVKGDARNVICEADGLFFKVVPLRETNPSAGGALRS